MINLYPHTVSYTIGKISLIQKSKTFNSTFTFFFTIYYIILK